MSKKNQLENIAKYTGILSFVLTLLSYGVRSFMGDSVYSYTLLSLGVLAFLGWIVWVTINIQRLLNARPRVELPNVRDGQDSSVWIPDGFSIRRVFYDSGGRNFFTDLAFTNGGDSKGKYDQPLTRESADETGIKIYRLQPDYRRIFTLMRYINTFDGVDNRAIPADNSQQTQGKYERYIVIVFDALVVGQSQNLGIRIRRRNGDWERAVSGQEILSHCTVNQKSWETFRYNLGPLRCDTQCRVSFEITGGPTGPENALCISNLRVAEVRK